jgi:hypothetical protein
VDMSFWTPRCRRPDGLVAPVRVDPSGLAGPTKRQAGGPNWRQTSAGLYVPSDVGDSIVEQRILEQGQRVYKHGAVTGWAAMRWHGAAYFNGEGPDGSRIPVPLVVGRRPLRCDPRVDIDLSQIAPSERLQRAGIWVTTVQRALFDVVRREPALRLAVAAIDMAAAARLISVHLMGQYVLGRFAWTGVPLVRRALALASNGSRSPMETLLRLVWVLDAQLPPPVCNVPVFDLGGQLLGYPDLLDVDAGMVGEYDGEHHRNNEQHRRDVAREELFRDHGLEYFTVVGGEIGNHSRVARRIHSTRSRAAFLSEDRRRWTLIPPPRWTPHEEPLDVHLVRTGEAAELVRF